MNPLRRQRTEERLEELLAARRHELEQQAARLEETLAEMERREQLVSDARASVERLLRLGTNDLDAREGDLVRFVDEVAERETRLREQEEDLARRRSELGAVELKRAALDQRERALDAREAALGEREGALAESAEGAELAKDGDAGVVYFVPGSAYRLVEGNGAPVRTGATVELEGEDFVVARVGSSPLPGDDRRCAYLVRGPRGSSSPVGSS